MALRDSMALAIPGLGEAGSEQAAQRRRVSWYLLVLAVVVLLYTLAYMAGMAVFEGTPVTFTKALLAVVESFTTTGYGEDAQGLTTWQMRCPPS